MAKLVAYCCVVGVVGVVASLSGCSAKTKSKPPPERGIKTKKVGAAQAERVERDEHRRAREIAVRSQRDDIQEVIQTEQEQQVVLEASRDMPAELRSAVGNPSSCFTDFSSDRATKIRLSVTASMSSSGLVTRASASGGGLSAKELSCVEDRVGRLRLRAPPDEKPRTVSTDIEIDYRPR